MSGIYLANQEALAYYQSCAREVKRRIDKDQGGRKLEQMLNEYQSCIKSVKKRIELSKIAPVFHNSVVEL